MGFMDKAKAKVGEMQATRAADNTAKAEAAAQMEQQKESLRGNVASTCPLLLTESGAKLPGGLELFPDEFIVVQGRDWGLSSDKLVITTQRIIKTEGRVNKSAETCYLSDVKDVLYHKSALHHATIAIQTSSGTIDGIPAAKNGEDLRNNLLKMVHWVRQQQNAPVAAGPQDGVPEQIKKLAELRDQGILSPEEFESKKADLLSRM
jgi:hypothetical protein